MRTKKRGNRTQARVLCAQPTVSYLYINLYVVLSFCVWLDKRRPWWCVADAKQFVCNFFSSFSSSCPCPLLILLLFHSSFFFWLWKMFSRGHCSICVVCSICPVAHCQCITSRSGCSVRITSVAQMKRSKCNNCSSVAVVVVVVKCLLHVYYTRNWYDVSLEPDNKSYFSLLLSLLVVCDCSATDWPAQSVVRTIVRSLWHCVSVHTRIGWVDV